METGDQLTRSIRFEEHGAKRTGIATPNQPSADLHSGS